jgi:hypothetical protein
VRRPELVDQRALELLSSSALTSSLTLMWRRREADEETRRASKR